MEICFLHVVSREPRKPTTSKGQENTQQLVQWSNIGTQESDSFFIPGMEDCETMEDVYMASVETDRGVKEQLHLYDTRGLQEGVDLPKHYFSFADGFVLVYSVNNLESFQRVELLKKEIDKFKDKKEVSGYVKNANYES